MANPRLRFRRADGSEYPDWEKTRFENLAEIIMGQSPIGSSVNSLGQGVPLVQGKADLAFDNPESLRCTSKPTKISDKDDIIMTVRAPVGYVTRLDFNVCLGRGVCAIRPNAVNAFVYQLLQKSEPRWRSIERGSTFTAVSADDIAQLNVTVPSNPEEQAKIAAFLSDLDTVISASEAEVAALEQLKKGAMQKIFSQKVRFKRDDGTEYPAWESEQIGDIIESYEEKVDTDSDFPILTSSKNYGIQFQSDHFGREQTHDIDGYNVLPRGYCTYRNRSDGVDFTFNINNICDVGIVSKFYPVFKDAGCDLYFLASFLNNNPTAQRVIAYTAVGTGQRVLSFSDLKSITLALPCPEEQQKIAKFLSTFDTAIAKAREETDLWRLLKRGLTQRMFV